MILPLDLVEAKISELNVPGQVSQWLALKLVNWLDFIRGVELHKVRPNIVLAAHFLVNVRLMVKHLVAGVGVWHRHLLLLLINY